MPRRPGVGGGPRARARAGAALARAAARHARWPTALMPGAGRGALIEVAVQRVPPLRARDARARRDDQSRQAARGSEGLPRVPPDQRARRPHRARPRLDRRQEPRAVRLQPPARPPERVPLARRALPGSARARARHGDAELPLLGGRDPGAHAARDVVAAGAARRVAAGQPAEERPGARGGTPGWRRRWRRGPGGWFVRTGCYTCHPVAVFGVKSPTPIGPDLSTAADDTERRFSRPIDEFVREPGGHDARGVLAAVHAVAGAEGRGGPAAARRLRAVPVDAGRRPQPAGESVGMGSGLRLAQGSGLRAQE